MRQAMLKAITLSLFLITIIGSILLKGCMNEGEVPASLSSVQKIIVTVGDEAAANHLTLEDWQAAKLKGFNANNEVNYEEALGLARPKNITNKAALEMLLKKVEQQELSKAAELKAVNHLVSTVGDRDAASHLTLEDSKLKDFNTNNDVAYEEMSGKESVKNITHKKELEGLVENINSGDLTKSIKTKATKARVLSGDIKLTQVEAVKGHKRKGKKSLPSLGSDKIVNKKSNKEMLIAFEASQFGEAFDEGGLDAYKENLELRLKSYGDDEVEKSISSWLSSYGTVNLSLDIFNNIKEPSGSLGMLHPIFDGGSQVFFGQVGYQLNNTSTFEGRDFLNIGLGWRALNDNYMFGLNAFYDVDMSRSHRRGSVGFEYFQDYLKASGNYYFPLSSWDRSYNSDYTMERVARGLDQKITGYLPSLPQLGLSLEYEQYFGNDVDILGNSHQESDPYAVTLRGEYSPVPLINIYSGIKKSKGESSSIEAGVNFNYHFGVSWRKQVSPSYVGESRLLSWNRHALVSRNNNIVLEYKKSEFVAAISDKYVTALNSGNNFKPLTLQVDIKGDKSNSYDVQWILPPQFIRVTTLPSSALYVSKNSDNKIEVLVPPFSGEYAYSAIVTEQKSKKSKIVTGSIDVKPATALNSARLKSSGVDLSLSVISLSGLHIINTSSSAQSAWELYFKSVSGVQFTSRLNNVVPELQVKNVSNREVILKVVGSKKSVGSIIQASGGLLGNYVIGDKSISLPIDLVAMKSGVPLNAGKNIFKTFGDAPFSQLPSGGNGGTLTYLSTNKKVVEVKPSTGLVHIIGAGKAFVTVTEASSGLFKKQMDKYSVTIAKAAGNQAGGHPIAPHAAISTTVGASNISAAATGGNGTLTYSVTPVSLASINASTGVLTLKAVGTATVKVTDAGDATHLSQTATTTVTIVPAPSPPVATAVTISGGAIERQTLTGSYVFSDVNGDKEGSSTFQWYRGSKVIAGQTGLTYTLVRADLGQTISFEVTPVSVTGTPATGMAVKSATTATVNYYTLQSVGLEWLPPQLSAQYLKESITPSSSYRNYGRFFHSGAVNLCQSIKVNGKSWRLPTNSELEALYKANGDMSKHGWNSRRDYWTSTATKKAGQYYRYDLRGGASYISIGSAVDLFVSCVSR